MERFKPNIKPFDVDSGTVCLSQRCFGRFMRQKTDRCVYCGDKLTQPLQKGGEL